MNNYTVYKHTSPSGKVYIGITSTSTAKRWNEGNGYKRHPYFYNAIKKYGWDNIKHEILFENLTKSMAIQKEIELIKKYHSNDRKFGYNATTGGESYEITPEIRHKISVSNQGHIVSYDTRQKISESEKGKIVSLESRQKMSVAQKQKALSEGTLNNLREMAKNRVGTHRTEETKQKISKALKGHPSTTPKGKNHPNYGKHLSDETRQKISKKAKARITDEFRYNTSKRFSKSVICVETGEIFQSITDAAKTYNISPSQLGAVCNHTGGCKTAGKLHWEFVSH